MDEKRVVNLEKRAVNKPGLILLFIIVLVGLGFGGYYFYNNRDYFSFYFPWENKTNNGTNEAGEKIDKKTGFRLPKEAKIKRDQMEVVKDEKGNSKTMSGYNKVDFIINDIIYDKEKGFTLNMAFNNDNDDLVKISVYNIDLDGYQTGLTFDEMINPKSSSNKPILLPNNILDLYHISIFNEITFYTKVTIGEDTTDTTIKIQISGTSTRDNITPIERIGKTDNITFNYYKVIEEKDRYILYIGITNNENFDITYYVNKFMIDNKEYKSTVPGKKIYSLSTFVDRIEIFKSDYKNIKNVTMSFFAVTDNNNIYQTKEKEVQL